MNTPSLEKPAFRPRLEFADVLDKMAIQYELGKSKDVCGLCRESHSRDALINGDGATGCRTCPWYAFASDPDKSRDETRFCAITYEYEVLPEFQGKEGPLLSASDMRTYPHIFSSETRQRRADECREWAARIREMHEKDELGYQQQPE